VDRIAFIDQGKLILQSDLENLKAGVRQLYIAADVSKEELERHFKVVRYDHTPQETKAIVLDFEDKCLNRLCQQNLCVQHVRTFTLNLEDIFVELVNKYKSAFAKLTENV